MQATIENPDLMPPHDLEAERCALASLMLAGDDRAAFDLTIAQLHGESFYLGDHGIIFDALVGMGKKGKKIDAVLIKAELERAGLFESIGGMGTLSGIINSVPSYHHGPNYAAVVREKYILREVMQTANKAIRRCLMSSRSDRASEIASEFNGELASLACTGTAERIHLIGDVINDVLDGFDKKRETRIKTGLIDLDEKTGGIPKGRFTQIGGRPGMGKSQLAKQIALNVARTGIPVGIVSIEETREKIGQNYLSNVSGIENCKIIYNHLSAGDYAVLADAAPNLANIPIYVADEPARLSEVEAAVTTMAVKHKCQLVIVDYLQLIDNDIAGDNENREITKTSKALKNAFKRLGIAGLVAVQLNRGNETGGVRRPTLRDLRGSGSLEQDGDLILLLHREDYYHKGEEGYQETRQLEVIIAKNKDGAPGAVPLKFSGKYQRITDWHGEAP